MAVVIDITNKLRKHLEEYCRDKGIKYSVGVKELAAAVGVNYRHIYAIANGNKKASSSIQFAICDFFGLKMEDIFKPVLINESQRSFESTNQNGTFF